MQIGIQKLLLSVVVPAYQAEGTIRRAIESVLSCRDTRLEVVVVNDGSMDETAEIVRDLAVKDGRIRLVNQCNSGRSAARNRGIAESRGERIMFLDSDDYLLDGAMDHVMELCEDPHALIVFPAIISKWPERIGYSRIDVSDAAQCSRFDVQADSFMRWMIYGKPDELCENHELACYETNSAWARLYKREYIKESEIPTFGGVFPVGIRLSEDRLFNLSYLNVMGHERVLFDSRPLYYWDLGESKTVALPSERDACDMLPFCRSVAQMENAGTISPAEASAICSREFFNRLVSSIPADYAGTSHKSELWQNIFDECVGYLNVRYLVLPAKGVRWAVTRPLLKSGHVGAAIRFEAFLRSLKRKLISIAKAISPAQEGL